MKKRSVIIIGAGACGLAAAERLSDEFDVTILEALDRTGGRVHTVRNGTGEKIEEAGAEFVHGELPVTLGLVEKAGAVLEKLQGGMYRVSKCVWKEEEDMIEGWDDLLYHMHAAPEDITLDAFLETYYPEPEYELLRRHTREYAAGFDLADPTRAGIKALYREWTVESDEPYRIRQGYGVLTDYLVNQCLLKGCRIYTGKQAAKINWRANHVIVETTGGELFKASKLVVTIPAGVMMKAAAKASVTFMPSIDNYIDAYRKLGFGSVVKIVIRFREDFWNDKRTPGFIFSEEIIPTWWTQSPGSPVLTGWLGGPSAVQWSGIDDATILNHAINSLAAIFKLSTAEIRGRIEEYHVFNWHTEPTFCGAYSYETPLSQQARTEINEPVAHTIYFAGEALYEGDYPGTVEAALQNGMDVADKICREPIFSTQPAMELNR